MHLPRKSAFNRARHQHPAQALPNLTPALTAKIEQKTGRREPTACGTCGETIHPDDQSVVRDEIRAGAPGSFWRHPQCRAARGPYQQLGHMLGLDWTTPGPAGFTTCAALDDVAHRVGYPHSFASLGKDWTDEGGDKPWAHIPDRDRARLAAAVQQRLHELTVPVRHESGWPCQVCGQSDELAGSWSVHDDRPACAACTVLIRRAFPYTRGNPTLVFYCLRLAGEANMLPARGWQEMLICRDAPGYRKLGLDEARVLPWEYCCRLPEPKLTDREETARRLAELEARLAAATT